MPNKYSHAFVLSNYQSHGIIDFESPRSSKSSPSPSPSTYKCSSKPQSSTATPSIANHASTSSKQPERLRLGSPTSHKTISDPPPLHRRSSSVETQIYAPISSPTPPPTRSCNDADVRERVQGHAHQPSTQYLSVPTRILAESQKARASESVEESAHRNQHSRAPKQANDERDVHPKLVAPQTTSKRDVRPSPKVITTAKERTALPSHQRSRRHSSTVVVGEWDHSSSTAYGDPDIAKRRGEPSRRREGSLQPLSNPYGRVPLSARAFVPERPPSPPATPDSDKSFSLTPSIEKREPTPPRPPVPERNPRRSPRDLSPTDQTGLASKSNNRSSAPRPKTASCQGSASRTTTFSTMNRTNSLNTASSQPSQPRTSSFTSNGPVDDKANPAAFRTSSSITSDLFAEDDADLESLPSTIDFNALPWCDHDISPAIFRDGQLNSPPLPLASPSMTRASSFDSAAPPPIALHRNIPPVLSAAESIPPHPQPTTPKTPKKAKPSIASLSFFRSAPKAILYSQTVPGKPPIPISDSIASTPSIPALFPDYKGQFPPPSRQPSQTRPSSQKGDERGSRTRRVMNSTVTRRGRSVPPKSASSDSRRRSWFKSEQRDNAPAVGWQGRRDEYTL